MKKLFALLAVAFGVMSCQTDVNDFGANVGGEQDVNILVSLPEATRANSAVGAFGNVDFDKYDIKYFFQVFDATNDDNCKAIQTKVCDDKEVSFPVRLIAGREYRFVVWAHLVDAQGHAHYTVGETLKDIKLNEDCWVAMDDTRDAYTGVKTATFTGSSDIAIELTRPFAKLRVVTTDMEELLGVEPVSAVVTYTNDTKFYRSFNALTETPADKTLTKGHDYEIKSYGETGAKKTLFADYFFAKDGDVVKFNIAVAMDDRGAAIERSFTTNIPVKRNTLTTIEGNILTEGDDIKVIVDDKFEAENIVIEGEYTLTADMEVNRPIVVLAGTEAVIDLNGFDIINTTASETFGEGEGIIAYGNLTIKGEGTVKGNTMAVWARGNNNATITIEGGDFEGCAEGYAKGGRSVVYASSGNVINIYGGTFKALAADKSSYADKTNGVYAALNVADNNGMINVYGGSFYKQNPAAPGTEPAAWNASHPNGFLAEGCVAEADRDWFNVIYDPYYGYTKVSTANEFKTALENGKSKIFLNSGNYEGTFHITVANVNIAGADDAKIIGRVHINGVNASFENVMFDRNETNSNEPNNTASNALQYKAVVMIYGDQTNTIKFNGCKFYNNNGTHKSAITNVACDLIVDNCYFEGRSSSIYSQANLSVTNSTFNYTGTNNVILSINGCGNNGGKVIFKNNIITNKIFVLSQFLSTVGFGNGTYHFDIQGNTADKFDYYWANIDRVTNKTFAPGSIDFSAPSL